MVQQVRSRGAARCKILFALGAVSVRIAGGGVVVTRARNGKSGWRRYGMLLGVTAIATFVLALPAAAQQCVSFTDCVLGGGSVQASGNVFVCVGGTHAFQTVCSNSVSNPTTIRLNTHRIEGRDSTYIPGEDSYDDFFDHIKKDPFVRFSSVHDGGAAISSASGTVSGQTASAHSTDVGGGVIGTYDRWNKTFNLTANQTLVVGGQFTFDSSRTTFGASTLARPPSSIRGL